MSADDDWVIDIVGCLLGWLQYDGLQSVFAREYLDARDKPFLIAGSGDLYIVFRIGLVVSWLHAVFTRWGGKAADGIDCSGVVFMVYLMNGVLIWRDADIREGYPMKAIWREGEEMCLVEERAKAGDLLFWRGHVGMYLGDGRYLHCTGHERVFGCRVNSLRRGDEDFREDLAEALKGVGSVFS